MNNVICSSEGKVKVQWYHDGHFLAMFDAKVLAALNGVATWIF